MTIKSQKLRDLYERYMNFINGNYIYAVINETTNTISISYSGEFARIIIKADGGIGALVLRITQDPTRKMSDTNGKLYYMQSIDDLNNLISASRVIMDLKVPSGTGGASSNMATEAMEGQGYLLDAQKNVLGVIDLKYIPTNAFVYNTDMINDDFHNEVEDRHEPEKKPFMRTIKKFFS